MGVKFDKMGKMKLGIIFPGQASQYIGMGREILEEEKELMEILKIGEKITNLPLIEKIFNGPLEDLTKTLFCQPSVFGISFVIWKYFFKKTDLKPVCVAGHSLGEYTALCVSNVFSLEEGFYLVKKRAEIMDKVSEKVNGGLLAIIGISISDVENIIKNFPDIEISNINSYTQIVVGGKNEQLEKLSNYLRGRKIKNIFLKVSGPFHTKYMKECFEVFSTELKKINFKNAEIPVYMNYSAKKTVDKDEIKENLLKQIYNPVRWVEIVEKMKDEVDLFLEIGPKNVLKKLIEGIVPDVPSFNIENPQTLNGFLQFIKSEERNV